MQVEVPKGKYILAVSGGVDSMVLLDMLGKKPGLNLVVAHFNHGIRNDSFKDEELVKQAAADYGLIFELGAAHLGKNASEAAARHVRYGFLNQMLLKHRAKAIITAHHQDDLIETAMINLIRGTGRLGLTAMASNEQIIRPLLITPKIEIETYARRHKLEWLEDPTNQHTQYLRNYLRLNILPSLTKAKRQSLICNIDKVAKNNMKINNEIATLSHNNRQSIDRNIFSSLPTEIGNEVVAHLLRQANVADFDSKTINRLSLAIKTSKPNSTHPVKLSTSLEVGIETARLVTP
jgi:tRNA(Ile)-lysidine synthase